MSTKLYIIALAAVLAAGSFAVPAYAQEMRDPTSGGTLDIMLTPEVNPEDGRDIKFHVSFLNPGTDQPHEHQDYDVVILQGGNEVFSAAQQTGQPVLHNVPGTLTVPYKFEENGDYVVRVELYGTGIPAIPTNESVEFPVTVTPEFPAGALGAVAAVMAGAIAVARVKLKR
jgi:hypothetical protein